MTGCRPFPLRAVRGDRLFHFNYRYMNWDIIKTAVAAFFGACIATLQPVHNAMLLLLIFAACDILFGILAGLIAARERFSFKKFILAAGYLLVYLGIVVMVYAVGKYQDDTQEALYVVKVITYVFIYFYSSNILKNLHLLMPDNPVIRFLDYFIGLQFTRKVAWLEEFLKKEQQGAGADGTEDDAVPEGVGAPSDEADRLEERGGCVMGKYFTVEELCVSAVARSRGIDNTPPPQAVAALHDLIGHLLDPLREAWGGPVAVNSGYRSPALNAAVGGAPRSRHMYGEAADITVGSPSANAALFALLESGGFDFDQLIDERGYAWLHVSWCRTNRRQVLHL